MRGTRAEYQKYDLLAPEAPPKLQKPSIQLSSKAVATGAIIAVALFVTVLLVLRLESAVGSSGHSPEGVARAALNALTAGKQGDFLELVEVKSFASRMDSTGVTGRDYMQADRELTRELEAMHGPMLLQDIFTNANTGKYYEITKQQLKETSAEISIKPWIQCGNRLYKRLLLEKRGEQWKITGLTTPDI